MDSLVKALAVVTSAPPLPLDWQARALAALSRRWPELLAFYHFGSTSPGDTSHGHDSADSDVDLAVLLPGKADPLSLWDQAAELAGWLRRDVDLVDLRAASTVMQYQIVTTGRRLWAPDAQAAIYESFILGEKTALDEARAGLLDDIRRSGRVHGG